MFQEFDYLFGSSFIIRKIDIYEKIVRTINYYGAKRSERNCSSLEYQINGRGLYGCLNELELAGFVRWDLTWKLTTGDTPTKKISRDRLSHNYLKFYLKSIDKYKTKIKCGSFEVKSLLSLPCFGGGVP